MTGAYGDRSQVKKCPAVRSEFYGPGILAGTGSLSICSHIPRGNTRAILHTGIELFGPLSGHLVCCFLWRRAKVSSPGSGS